MALLKKLKGFTLMETLVAGLLVTLVGSVSLVIYLNISGSLAKTQDLVLSSIAKTQMDSLSHVKGPFEKYYAHRGFGILSQKTSYKNETEVFMLYLSIEDPDGNSLLERKKLIYEAEED